MILSNVLYEPFGPVAGWSWGNGTLAARVYDADGLPTAIDSAEAYAYGYDEAFRITRLTDQADATKSWTYGYDLLDRLTAASTPGQVIGYTYDANGNRLTQSGSQSATYTISPASNRLASIAGTPARTYAYDAAGNTLGYDTLTFTYSGAGRMRAVANAGVTTTYVISALGQRVKKTSSTGTTYFMYDEAGHLAGEYDGSGALLQETVWLEDIPVATLRPAGSGIELYSVHTDHLNTPRRITRPADNAIVWRWDADPFGAAAANEDPDGDSTLFVYNLRFPGQYHDAESGLSYNYFRDYDFATGRYAQSDPIGLRGGINTYAYALSNPVELFDPSALRCVLSGTRALTDWSEVAHSASYGRKSVSGIAAGAALICLWSRDRFFKEERLIQFVWDCWECENNPCATQNCQWIRTYVGPLQQTRSSRGVERWRTAGLNFHDGYNDIETGGTGMCPDPWGGPPARLSAPNP